MALTRRQSVTIARKRRRLSGAAFALIGGRRSTGSNGVGKGA
jgi:hypothetical protein